MSKKILFVDMDNVLVDFPSALAQLPSDVLREYNGLHHLRTGLQCDINCRIALSNRIKT